MWLHFKIIVSKSHENTSNYVDAVTFFNNLNQRSLAPRWPLTQVCCGHMCGSTQESLCPSPMKIHQSMWIQWPFFSKTWTKGHWSLDDLWPYIFWGHMCDSTQGLLCLSPMGIHQCMWIQWSLLHNFNQDYHILHTTYGMNHIVSFWTKFRRDKTHTHTHTHTPTPTHTEVHIAKSTYVMVLSVHRKQTIIQNNNFR